MSSAKKFYGKYRGTVVENVDPNFLGRIQAIVPDVSHGVPSSWAMPCVPIAGLLSGTYVVPQIGAGVWIEYEHGDPDHPIWVGCFWGEGQIPPLAEAAPPGDPPVVISTTLQNSVVVSDVPVAPMVEGGVMFVSGASSITISPTMVQIISPMITINGVMIVNDGALAVAIG
jgi:hypothetical protein